MQPKEHLDKATEPLLESEIMPRWEKDDDLRTENPGTDREARSGRA
jgi:hypothetical protein